MSDGVQVYRGPRAFRGPEACKEAGVTYRQLDYWARTDLVPPSIQVGQGPGSHRLFSESDVLRLKLIRELVRHGASIQAIRIALDFAADEWADVLYAVNGNSVFVFTGAEDAAYLAGFLVSPTALKEAS